MDTREQELVRKWRLLLVGVAGVIVVGVAASILVSAWLNALNADQARMLFEATDTGLGRRDYNQLGGQIDALRWLMAGVLGYTIGAVVVLVRAAQDAFIALDVERGRR